MTSTKLKIAVATVLVAGVTAPLVVQHRAVSRLRAENVALRQQLESPQPSAPSPEPAPAEATRIDVDRSELLRLRGEVAMLRKEREELAHKLATISAAATNKSSKVAPPYAEGTVDTAWVQQVVAGPPSYQGGIAGAIRGKGIREGGRGLTASDAAVQNALLERQLNHTLERSPADFADFQSAFIQGAVGITDPGKVEQIRQIIRQTYEDAVARGLDIPSKPATDFEQWAKDRWQLDHANTKAVKALLTPEERKFFGRAFIGIMGVDLGGMGVDKSNYPPGVVGP